MERFGPLALELVVQFVEAVDAFLTAPATFEAVERDRHTGTGDASGKNVPPPEGYADGGEGGVMRLHGVRVLDLTRYLPGPYATQLLADAGADVIKIEDMRRDPARFLGFEIGSAYGTLFDAANRGKRSVALDLKTEAGTAAFFALAADADVVIEGFRPGVATGSASATRRSREQVRISSTAAVGLWRDWPRRDPCESTSITLRSRACPT